jgi:hypothetical protein
MKDREGEREKRVERHIDKEQIRKKDREGDRKRYRDR